MSNFDLVVIGAGPGGYVAAIKAAQLGLKTAIIEREHLGGICLNWGCIPTKALLRSAEIYRNIKHAESYGLSVKDASYDLAKIIERSRGVSKQLSSGIGSLLKKNKIETIMGTGKLLGNSKVEIKTQDGKSQTLTAKHIIVATGARARVLKGLEPDGKNIWSYKEALVADRVPKKLVVLGSGAIGIEFASFFNTLGSKTTVIEMLSTVMPVEDKEISEIAKKSFQNQGMEILTSTKLLSATKIKDGLQLTIEDSTGKKSTIEADVLITAVGVVPNTENIGLENTKAKTDKGLILVNDFLATEEAGLYAIGDVVQGPWLAHKASHEAIICVEKIAGKSDVHPLNRKQIAGCTYCHPQVASIGLTEEKAKEQGYSLKIGKFPFMANGKAIALGEKEGLVKTIFDAKTGELLGAHMIGAEVTELIQGFAVAMGLETTNIELSHTIFPHPTLSEMMHEATLAAFGLPIHI